MSYATERIILFDRNMQPLPEIPPDDVISRVRTEEINGEHKLTLKTLRQLEEGWRALTVDGFGKWREYVVTEMEDSHDSGRHSVHTYNLVWSLQYDLTNAYSHTHAEIGYGDMPKQSQQVAAAVLQDVPYWTVGACDAASVPADKGAVFIYESAWSRLSKAVEVMGCEVDAEIEVSNVFGVTARKLCLKAHLGNETALRRFDWGHDLTSVKRTPDPGPYYCRVVPLGKGEQEYADDDETTFEWPIDITEETGTEQNPGPYWIQDDEAAAVFRRSDGSGGWIYPTLAVTYSSEDDPELLLAAAQEDLHNHTRPGVTYEASVVQLEQAGMDVHGVALGDEVQVVDYGFNEDAGLRISGRVIKMEVDELSPRANTTITIGQLRDTLTDVVSALNATFDQLEAQNNRIYQSLAEMTTARYIDQLLDRINTEIAATGGYTYLVPGEGLITYDTAVSDPLVGSEATRVVQLKGGYLRIADSKKTPFSGIDDWEFKTILDSGHIIADLITAVKVTSGYIGNATNSNYWNLDTGELVIRTIYTDTDNTWSYNFEVNNVEYLLPNEWRHYYIHNAVYTGSKKIWGLKVKNQNTKRWYDGSSYHTPVATWLLLVPDCYSSNFGKKGTSSILSNGNLALFSNVEGDTIGGYLRLTSTDATLELVEGTTSSATKETIELFNGRAYILASEIYLGSRTKQNQNYSHTITGNTYFSGSVYVSSELNVYTTAHCNELSTSTVTANRVETNGLYVNGSKSRVVDTQDYDKRLLYAYETPSPLFGDVGSGCVGSDGLCYVMLDDVFSETVATGTNYQVFLQKMGEGDIWVAEKADTYFVVQGTPMMRFDWEAKVRQADYPTERLESFSIISSHEDSVQESVSESKDIDTEYTRELSDVVESAKQFDFYDDYVSELEHIYDDDIAA